MTSKEYILGNIRASLKEGYAMPDLDKLNPVKYDDAVGRFMECVSFVGGKAVTLKEGEDINTLINSIYPDAKLKASALEYIEADLNPDIIVKAEDLNGVDVGIVEGRLAVAENGCVWVPQTMKERAVCFISEYLVMIVNREDIVNNMHEAYSRIEMSDYGYGCFISGPSKTADIAQALVMGAQAARGVTVIIR